jgi:hypothetical protein
MVNTTRLASIGRAERALSFLFLGVSATLSMIAITSVTKHSPPRLTKTGLALSITSSGVGTRPADDVPSDADNSVS